MGNAFENVLNQTKQNNSIDKRKSEINLSKKTTSKHVDKSINNKENITTRTLERKTVYLKPEIIEMFKYVKWKNKVGESEFANAAIENHIEKQFGKNWRDLLKAD
jgi:hypothetical protein